MKSRMMFSIAIAAAGLLALAAPAEAQRSRGSGPSSGAVASRGGSGNFHGPSGNFHGGRFYGGRFYGGRGFYGRGFYYGGFYPYYGFGYGYPFGYYGYPYGYGYVYPPYYGYGNPGYGYDQQGVYNGRVVPNRDNRNSRERDPKDQSSVESQVQERLAQAGFYHGNIDGVVGEGTRRAIRSYERANGLRVDGRIDDRLLSTMGIG